MLAARARAYLAVSSMREHPMPSVEPALESSPDRMRDQWWWRPGWRPGRRFYTWHLTFDQASAQGSYALEELVEDYQAHLAVPGLDLVPVQWLHLTMQGLGFTDEISESDVQRIVTAAAVRCGDVAPATLALGPATVDPEGIMLRVSPAEPAHQVRAALRRAIA